MRCESLVALILQRNVIPSIRHCGKSVRQQKRVLFVGHVRLFDLDPALMKDWLHSRKWAVEMEDLMVEIGGSWRC